MSWIDQLNDRQRREVTFARMYAVHFADDTAPVASYLLLISALAELLDMQAGALTLARLRAPVSGTPLEALIAAARAAGAAGTWILRGSAYAALQHGWPSVGGPALELTPPHEIVILIRIPESDGGEPGIEFYGPTEE